MLFGVGTETSRLYDAQVGRGYISSLVPSRVAVWRFETFGVLLAPRFDELYHGVAVVVVVPVVEEAVGLLGIVALLVYELLVADVMVWQAHPGREVLALPIGEEVDVVGMELGVVSMVT